MICVNEWNPPAWIALDWNAIPPIPGHAPKRPPAPAKRAPDLVAAIDAGLRSLRARPPSAVHFYMGEGLRWIRVGFATKFILEPADVLHVGGAIAACTAHEGTLYFHALRPHDLLFFLEGGDGRNRGMPATSFGVPLVDVLERWKLVGPPPASRKTRPRARVAA